MGQTVGVGFVFSFLCAVGLMLFMLNTVISDLTWWICCSVRLRIFYKLFREHGSIDAMGLENVRGGQANEQKHVFVFAASMKQRYRPRQKLPCQALLGFAYFVFSDQNFADHCKARDLLPI